MRIISGTHRGRKITPPRNLPVRPTTDRAKEALFNILGNRFYFEEIKVLDLFAGTGNISFEFASRGSRDIISVDQHAGCVKFIQEKSAEWGLPIRAVRMDVFKYLQTATGKFDLILADPPYNFSEAELKEIHDLIYDRELLEPDGTLIIEHSKKTDLSSLNHLAEVRKYGNSWFSFFTEEK
ncbi:RsmD family RNA methyltransferase [Muriicola marianensis]|uniref:Methyltransferase n=1 Tax=Muriicola marianensis TaxID=1324801 RepID=A0ABQ1QTX4_9FLAO|nr:RsmD family RNA methyltransferase [Muriicola marianensis]GGD41958.1 methyltransferase [Muriicola marianensis]